MSMSRSADENVFIARLSLTLPAKVSLRNIWSALPRRRQSTKVNLSKLFMSGGGLRHP